MLRGELFLICYIINPKTRLSLNYSLQSDQIEAFSLHIFGALCSKDGANLVTLELAGIGDVLIK